MRERVDRARLRAFMHALAEAARRPLQVYLVGGATAVLEDWRDATIDVDLALGGDADAVLRALPAIKEQLDLNVELASPADFIPVKPGWEDRSPFVAQEGPVTFRHFDLSAQALAKIERGHDTDRKDIGELIGRRRGVTTVAVTSPNGTRSGSGRCRWRRPAAGTSPRAAGRARARTPCLDRRVDPHLARTRRGRRLPTTATGPSW